MVLLELAAQAVRGFSPSVRVQLKSGYVALKSPTDIPAPLAGLVIALCFPDGRGGDATYLAPGAKTGRAGLSIQGQDQQVWRVVRDLGGAGGLHKLNRATNQFEVVSQDSAEMGQTLRAAVGFPARTTFDHIFTFTAAQLPTRRPRGVKKPKAGKGRALQSAFEQYGLGGDEQELRDRLAKLEQELVVAKEAAELQFRFDGLQGDLFQAESRLKAASDLRARLDAAREELQTAPTPKSLGLPDDIVERVKRYPEEKRRHKEALAKLFAERDEALAEGSNYVEPLYRDQRFLMAVVGGLALLIGPVFLEGGMRRLALLAIPAFTFATLLALRFVEDLQHNSRESAKTEVFTVREKRLADEFALSSSIVQSALEKTEVVTADEFFITMARREQLQPTVTALELEYAEFAADPQTERLPETCRALRAEMEEINERLQQLSGGYVREVREIERDLAKVKESLAPPAPAADFSAVPTGPTESWEDPTPEVLLLGTDLFTTDVPTLWGTMRDRCVQYFTALTDRRYHGVDVDKEGHATVQAPGRAIAASELPGKDLDLLYLSVRLTLLERYNAQTKVPIIIEDAFAGVIDPAKQGLFGRMLKHISTLTQVLHVTGVGQTVAAADAVLSV